jgi:hypothetical protein
MIARAFLRRIRPRAVNSKHMLALVAAVLACAPQGSLGKDLPAGTDEGGSTAAVTDGSSTTDAADGTTSTASTAGSGDGASSTGETGEGSTTATDACLPAAEDSACTACIKGHCCGEWLACQASEPCTCIDTCIADGGDPTACVETHCGGPNDDWIHLHDCSAEPCVDVC